MHQAPNFAIYYAGDAYSTKNKIMGRQSAGKAFMKGVARTWPKETIHGTGPSDLGAQAMIHGGKTGFGDQAGNGLRGLHASYPILEMMPIIISLIVLSTELS